MAKEIAVVLDVEVDEFGLEALEQGTVGLTEDHGPLEGMRTDAVVLTCLNRARQEGASEQRTRRCLQATASAEPCGDLDHRGDVGRTADDFLGSALGQVDPWMCDERDEKVRALHLGRPVPDGVA